MAWAVCIYIFLCGFILGPQFGDVEHQFRAFCMSILALLRVPDM